MKKTIFFIVILFCGMLFGEITINQDAIEGQWKLFVEGKPYTGATKSFFETGEIRGKANYRDSLLDGEYEIYNRAGNIITSYIFENHILISGFSDTYYRGNLVEKIIVTGPNRYIENKKDENKEEITEYIIVEIPSEYKGLNYNNSGYQRKSRNGKYTIKTDNKIVKEGEYHLGLKTGLWKTFFEDGKVHSEVLYENGNYIGVSKFYYNTGELFEEIDYSSNTGEGIVTGYYKDGKLQKKGGIYKEKRNLKFEFFDENEDLIRTGWYREGIINDYFYLRNDEVSEEVKEFYKNLSDARAGSTGDPLLESGEKESVDYKLFYENKVLYREEILLSGKEKTITKEYYENGTLYREYDNNTNIEKIYNSMGNLTATKDYTSEIRRKIAEERREKIEKILGPIESIFPYIAGIIFLIIINKLKKTYPEIYQKYKIFDFMILILYYIWVYYKRKTFFSWENYDRWVVIALFVVLLFYWGQDRTYTLKYFIYFIMVGLLVESIFFKRPFRFEFGTITRYYYVDYDTLIKETYNKGLIVMVMLSVAYQILKRISHKEYDLWEKEMESQSGSYYFNKNLEVKEKTKNSEKNITPNDEKSHEKDDSIFD